MRFYKGDLADNEKKKSPMIDSSMDRQNERGDSPELEMPHCELVPIQTVEEFRLQIQDIRIGLSIQKRSIRPHPARRPKARYSSP